MRLANRRTQIIPLEATVPLLAISVWKSELGGCRLIIMIDNQSAIGALKKGRSKSSDIQSVITATVDQLDALHIRPEVFWVPSNLNIADIPSRGHSLTNLYPDIFHSRSEVNVSRAVQNFYNNHGW